MEGQLAGDREWGWFDETRYARQEQTEITGLRDVIVGFQNRGAEAIVVIMPENRALRSRVPAEAKRFLVGYLSRQFRTPRESVGLR
jgi:hypothetical protein